MFSLLLLEEGAQLAAKEAAKQGRISAFDHRCTVAQQKRDEAAREESARLEAKQQRHAAAAKLREEQHQEEVAYNQQRAVNRLQAVRKARDAQLATHYDQIVDAVAAKDARQESWKNETAERLSSKQALRQQAHDETRRTLLKRQSSTWNRYYQDFAKNPDFVPPEPSVLSSLLFEATAKRSATAGVNNAGAGGVTVSHRLRAQIAAGATLPQLLAAAEEQNETEQRLLDEQMRQRTQRRAGVKSQIAEALREQRVARIVASRSGAAGVREDLESGVRAELAAAGETTRDASRTTKLAAPRLDAAAVRQALLAKEAARSLNQSKAEEQVLSELEDAMARRAARHNAAERRRDSRRGADSRRVAEAVSTWRCRVDVIEGNQRAAERSLSQIISESPVALDVQVHQQRAEQRQESIARAREKALQDSAQSFVLRLTRSR
jgi:hypothetical protein